jgi:hypothetical protein
MRPGEARDESHEVFENRHKINHLEKTERIGGMARDSHYIRVMKWHRLDRAMAPGITQSGVRMSRGLPVDIAAGAARAAAGCGRLAVLAAGLAVLGLALASPASASSRIKDIASFEGIRDNLLIGYGLVVGLNGTGDDVDSAVFTRQSLEAMLERLGVNVRGGDVSTDNVAAVIVSADLPSFARHGTRIDITGAIASPALGLRARLIPEPPRA